MSKKSSKANKDFLEKIKTITVGTGVKQSGVKCPDCGETLKQYVAIGVAVVPLSKEPEPVKHKESEETSFAA